MRKSGILRLIPAVFLSLAISVHAAGPAEPLPPQIEGQLSIKSPMGLLDSLDAYVSTTTKDTPHALPPGILPMLAAMSLPIPLDTWDSEGEAHMLFLENGAKEPAIVIVVNADNFEELVSSLDDRGWGIGEIGENGGFEKTVSVEPPNAKSVVLVDLGNGKVAGAEEIDHVAKALDGGNWLPKHPSDADVFFVYDINVPGESFHDRAVTAMEGAERKLPGKLEESGINREVAEGVARAMKKYIPLLAKELDHLESATVELRLDPVNALIDIGGKFSEGSVSNEIANDLAKAPALDNPFLKNVPDSVASVTALPPATAFLSKAPERIEALVADFYGMIFPEIADGMRKATSDFFASGIEGSVAVGFLKENRQYNFSLFKTDEPGKAMQTFVDSLELFGKAWNKTVSNSDYGMTLKTERVDEGGISYMRSVPEFANPEKFRRLLAELAEEHRDVRIDFDMLLNMRAFFATQDGMLMIGAGEMTDEDFREGFALLKGKAEKAMIDRSSVKKIQPALSGGKGSVSYIDADKAFMLVATEASKNMDMLLGISGGDAYRAALEKVRGELQNKGDIVALAIGAEDGWLLGRFAVPVSSANAILADYVKFDAFRKKAMAEQIKKESIEADEVEDEDAEDEEEEVEVTDEDDAA